MRRCPHGDPFCPCQDGDACHYEGDDPDSPDLAARPMPCPNPPRRPSGFHATAMRFMPLDASGKPIPGESFHLVPPSPPPLREPHCHVEGCRWPGTLDGLCGLERLPDPVTAEAADELGCGMLRHLLASGRVSRVCPGRFSVNPPA